MERETSQRRKIRLGVLASHGGTNLQAILDRIERGELDAEVRVVISNNSKATALERARKHGIEALHMSDAHFPSPEELDRALVKALRERGVELVVFAGYMKKRGPEFIRAFKNRILNIHPALLPKFGGAGMYGIRVHEAVLAAGERESGVTVHIVDEIYDHGSNLMQKKVPVLAGDTPETLAARVLEQEHILYSEVIQKIASGEILLPPTSNG
jgi:phosphoribosylglycinamide formyltransferase-1